MAPEPGRYADMRATLRVLHADTLATWDKHFAQSADDGVGGARVLAITLATSNVEGLRDLVDELSGLLHEELEREAAALLELARRISFC